MSKFVMILIIALIAMVMLTSDVNAQSMNVISPSAYAPGTTTYWFEVEMNLSTFYFSPSASIILQNFPEEFDIVAAPEGKMINTSGEYKDSFQVEVSEAGWIKITNPTETSFPFSQADGNFLTLKFGLVVKEGQKITLPYKSLWDYRFINFWGPDTVQANSESFVLDQAKCLVKEADGTIEDNCKWENTMKFCNLKYNECRCENEDDLDTWADCLGNDGNGTRSTRGGSSAMGLNTVGVVMMAAGVVLAVVGM